MPDRDRDVEEYVAANYARFRRTAFLVTGNQQDAEDVVQDALTKLVSQWHRVVKAESPDAYVHRSILNAGNSLWRRPFRRRERSVEAVPEELGHRDHQIDDWATSKVLLDGLKRLELESPTGWEERRSLVAKDVERMSWEEIASALNMSVSTAKRRRADAIKKLRAFIEEA